MESWAPLLFSGLGAAVATGIFTIAQYKLKRSDERSDREDAEHRALRYLMLYIIQERCKEHISAGEISLEDLSSLRKWYELYHNDLGGNGDAEAIFKKVEALKIITN